MIPISPRNHSFTRFVAGHTNMLLIALVTMCCLLLWFKVIYPTPDFFVDSFVYIAMAANQSFIGMWPIGYSWCLRAIHMLGQSDYVLIILQYLLLQVSALWLAFTLFYIARPAQWVKVVVVVFITVNPLALYLANFVSSDALFTACSLCWLTLLVQMVHRPRLWLLLLQGPLLALLFTIRYQAIYYPLVMLVALLLTRYALFWRLVSAAIGLLLIGWFVKSTEDAYDREFGLRQFSPGGGWMLGYNALYMYPHIQVDTAALSNEHRFINAIVHDYFDTCSVMERNMGPRGPLRFVVNPNEPLSYYANRALPALYRQRGMWLYNKTGKDFNAYAKQLIQQHPVAFIHYYAGPNALCYLVPMLEHFNIYAEGRTYINVGSARWFGLPTNAIASAWPRGGYYLLGWYPWLFLLLHVLLVAGIIISRKHRRYQRLTSEQKRCFWLLVAAVLGNAVFSSVAAPVMLRYQAFALVVLWVLGLLLISNQPEPDVPA